MSCEYRIPIEHFPKATIQYFEDLMKKEKKPKYDFLNITTQTENENGEKVDSDERIAFNNLFSSGSDFDNAVETLLDSLEDRNDIRSKLVLFKSSKLSGFLKLLNISDLSIDNKIKAILAIKHVLSGLETEEKLSSKHKIAKNRSNEEIVKSMKDSTSLTRIKTSIGRDIATSLGIFPGGKKIDVENGFISLADEAIKLLEDSGIITINSHGNFNSGGLRDLNGDPVGNISKDETVSLNNSVFNDSSVDDNSKLDWYGNEKLNGFTQAISELDRLISPHKESLVYSEPQGIDMSIQQRTISHPMKKAITYLQNSAFSINSDMAPIFDELHKIYVNSGKNETSFKKELIKVYGSINGGSDMLFEMLGINTKKLSERISKQSEIGIEISRVSPMILMMQDYENMSKEKFFYTYFAIDNSRLFQNQTAANIQSEKKMFRNMVSSSEQQTISGEDKIDRFKRRLSVAYNISLDAINGTDTSNSFLESMIQQMALIRSGNEKFKQASSIRLMFRLANNRGKTLLKSNSIWEEYKAISAILDVRLGKKNNEIKTNMIFESDASASGIVIKFLQNAHRPEVQEILTRMGLGKDGKELLDYMYDENSDYLEDSYKIGSEQIDKMVDSFEILMEPSNLKETLASLYPDKSSEELDELSLNYKELESELKSPIDYINNLIKITGISRREMLKYMIMRFSYGQRDKNNANEFGDEVSLKVINNALDNNDNTKINELIKEFDIDINDGKDFTERLTFQEQEELKTILSSKISGTTGIFMTDNVFEKAYAIHFDDTDKNIQYVTRMTSRLDQPRAKDKNGKIKKTVTIEDSSNIVSALEKVLWIKSELKRVEGTDEKPRPYDYSKRKNNVGLDKKFPTLFTGLDKKQMIVTLKHYNEISGKVTPIHNIDAAILIVTIFETYDKILGKNKINNKYEVAKKAVEYLAENPMATIHDAIMSTLEVAEVAEPIYEQNIMDINYHYDILSEIVAEFEYKLNANAGETVDGEIIERKELPSKIKKIKEVAAENFAKRKEFMDQFRKEDGSFMAIGYSFATNISDQEMKKIANEYNEKLKNINKGTSSRGSRQDNSNNNSDNSSNSNNDSDNSNDNSLQEDNVPKDIKEHIDKLISVFGKEPIIYYDYETNFTNKTDSDNGKRTPNEIFLKKVMPDGTIEKLHIVLPIEPSKINEHDLHPDRTSSFSSSVEIEKMAKDFKANPEKDGTKRLVAKSKEDMNNIATDFIDGNYVVGFNNSDFDDKVLTSTNDKINLKSIDAKIIAKLFNSKNNSNGTQIEFAKKLLNKSDEDLKSAHTSESDVNILEELVNYMHEKISNNEVETKEINSKPKPFNIINFIDSLDISSVDSVYSDMLNNIKDFIIGSNIEFNISDTSKYFVKNNKEVIDINSKQEVEKIIEDLDHEITHAKTLAWIVKNQNSNEVRYILKAIPRLVELLKNNNSETSNRINEINSFDNDIEKAAEMVAMLKSHPEMIKEIYAIKDKRTAKLARPLERVLHKIKNIVAKIKKITTGDIKKLETAGINMSKLFGASNLIVIKGAVAKNNNPNESVKIVGSYDKVLYSNNNNTTDSEEAIVPQMEYTPAKQNKDNVDLLSKYIHDSNGYIAQAIESGFVTAQPYSKELAIKIHNWSIEKSPLYKRTTDIISNIWESNEFVQLFKNYTNPDVHLETKLRKLHSVYKNAHDAQRKIIESVSRKMDKKFIEAGITDKEHISDIDYAFARTGIYGIYRNKMLFNLVTGEKTLKELISEAESNLMKSGGNSKVAKSLAMLYIDKPEVGSTNANIDMLNGDRNSKIFKDYEALASLYAINEISGSVEVLTNMFENHREIFDDLINLAQQVKIFDDKIHEYKHDGKPDMNVSRGNMITDIANKQYDIIPVSFKQLNESTRYDEANGWKILRKPNRDGKIGLVYREKSTTIQNGLITDSYLKTGVKITEDQKKDPKIFDKMSDNSFMVTSPANKIVEHHLMLTREEKSQLGYYSHPVKSLLRSYAHKELIYETQSVRDYIMGSMRKEYLTIEDMNNDIEELYKEGKHPPFIKIDDSVNLETNSKISKLIRQKYRKVDRTIISDIGNAKEKVSWVRKDIGEEISGFKEEGIFKNEKWNAALNDFKHLIRFSKIILIVVNAPKIALDFAAGMAVSSGKGASFTQMYKYGKEAVKGSKEIIDLMNEKITVKFDLAMYDGLIDLDKKSKLKKEALEERLSELEKKIKTHYFSPAIANGFIQSLGTDIMSKDTDSVQGLQVRMEEIIGKFTRDDKGKLTKFNNIVKKMSNFGGDKFGLDTFYAILGDNLNRFEATKGPGDVLNDMSEHLKNLKSEDDVTRYIAEMMAAPNSSIVRLGGAMTVYADLIPRWIIYKTNVDKGMNEDNALNDALRALPNYMKEMPSGMKFLSDIYLLPFPSFYTRIQSVILNLGLKHPVSFASQLISSEYLGLGGSTILRSNLITKYGNDSLFSNPTDLPAIPYSHLFG